MLFALTCAVAALGLTGCPELPTKPEPDGDTSFLVDVTVDTGDTPEPDSGMDTRIPPDEPQTVVAFDTGELVVTLDEFSWRFSPYFATIFSRPRDPGVEPSLQIEYGPSDAGTGFDNPNAPFDGPTPEWQVVDFEQEGQQGALTLTLENVLAPEHGTVTVEIAPDHTAGGVHFDVLPEPPEEFVARRIEFAWTDNGGPLYGTGQRFDAFNMRGHLRTLVRDLHPFLEGGSNHVDVPVPFVFNPRGYGIFVDSEDPGAFDLAATNEFVLRARFNTSSLRLHLFADSTPFKILDRYSTLTSLPSRPPNWALAPQLTTAGADAAAIESDVRRLRAADLPLGAVWLGDTWQGAYSDISFNDVLFPEPGAFADTLHGLGLALVGRTTPYFDISDDSDVAPGFGSAQALFDDASSQGYLVENAAGEPLELAWRPARVGGMLDATQADALAWWQGLAQPTVDVGLDGLWLERGDDLFPQTIDDVRVDGNPASARLVGDYGTLFAGVLETLVDGEDDDGLVASNTGGATGQSVIETIVPRVIASSFDTTGSTTVGGLPAALNATLSLSTSGYPFASAPVGGTTAAPDATPNPELLLRWTAMAVFNPMMRFGPGQLDAQTFDALSEAHQDALRALLKLRIRLSAYIEQLAEDAALTGAPVAYPAPLAFPDEAQLWDADDVFMLGEDILVAPVLASGQVERTVFLPGGQWRSWSTGQQLEGGQEHTVSAPLGSIPVFAAEGALIPLRLEVVDTLGDASDPDVVTASDSDGTMHVRAMGLGTGTTELPDGGIVSTNFSGGWTVLNFQPGNTTQTIYVEFVGSKPIKVVCDGIDVPSNDSIAIVPIEDNQTSTSYRRLTNGTLVRMRGPASCEIQWP